MTLWESKESKGTVSLKDLFEGGKNFPWDMNADFTLDDVAFLLCRGGWPISVLAPRDIAIEITKNYYNGLFVFEDSENERFRNKIIEKSDEKAPSFLLVLTAVGGAYKRDDGVYVAPINLLKP